MNIEDEETPLQGKLATIANQVGGIGVAVAILTFVIVTTKLVVSYYLD
jgi:hypothetical protein